MLSGAKYTKYQFNCFVFLFNVTILQNLLMQYSGALIWKKEDIYSQKYHQVDYYRIPTSAVLTRKKKWKKKQFTVALHNRVNDSMIVQDVI